MGLHDDYSCSKLMHDGLVCRYVFVIRYGGPEINTNNNNNNSTDGAKEDKLLDRLTINNVV